MSSGRREAKRVLLVMKEQLKELEGFMNRHSGYEGRAERIGGELRIDHWSLEFLSWGISRILRSRMGDCNAVQQRRFRNPEVKLLTSYLHKI